MIWIGETKHLDVPSDVGPVQAYGSGDNLGKALNEPTRRPARSLVLGVSPVEILSIGGRRLKDGGHAQFS
jgi:hypothetical protein